MLAKEVQESLLKEQLVKPFARMCVVRFQAKIRSAKVQMIAVDESLGGLPTDKPTNRKIEEFYDNSLVEGLVREGFLKTLDK